MRFRQRFRDLLIVIPGIGGSELYDGDRPIFKPMTHTLRRVAVEGTRALDQLAADPAALDDPERERNVHAPRLIGLPVSLPGLAKVNQYRTLRESLHDAFELTDGSVTEPGPLANYFEFPYDWRRDIRMPAAQLADFVNRELPRWRSHLSGAPAKTVIVAHSMGGLVARHYLESLDGARDCRALFTYGTPYRGSLAALGVLASGLRLGDIAVPNVAEVLRRFTSVHQLLPRFPAIWDHRSANVPTRPTRISDLGPRVGDLDTRRAVEALNGLHDPPDTGSLADWGVRWVPVVGYGHPTLLSATLDRRGLRTGTAPIRRDESDPWRDSGDRTVPAFSALPVGRDGKPEPSVRYFPVNQTHSTVHCRPASVNQLVMELSHLSGSLSDPDLQTDPTHPATDRPTGAFEPSIGIDLADSTEPGEPVVLHCTVPPGFERRLLNVRLDPPAATATATVAHDDAGFTWTADGLPAGTYEVLVDVDGHSAADIVEVG